MTCAMRAQRSGSVQGSLSARLLEGLATALRCSSKNMRGF